MLFNLDDRTTLEKVLSIPIPYTEELEETKLEKFVKKLEKGTLRISETEMKNHIQQYFTRSDGSPNFWMYQLYPDVKKHFLETKMKSLQPDKHPDEMFHYSFAFLERDLKYIYLQDFMNILPLKEWENFIHRFTVEMKMVVHSIQNKWNCLHQIKPFPYHRVFTNYEKRLCEDHAMDIIQNFEKTFSFINIQHYLFHPTMSNFQKIRNIRSFLRLWEMKNNLNRNYLEFEIEQWTYFFKICDKYRDRNKAINYVLFKYPIKKETVTLIKTKTDFYKFFGWRQVQVLNKKKEIIPLTKNFIENFFNETSHFEENVFWWRNMTPYYILYDNEIGNEEMFLKHKQESNWKNGLFECPVKYACHIDLEKLHHFCVSKFPSSETWNFIIKINSSISMLELFKRCFNVIGRLCREYPSSEYHYSIHEKLEQQILVKKELTSCKQEILFPEYYFNKKQTQKEFDVIWKQCFDFFQEQYINILEGTKNENVLYIEKIPTFYHPPENLTYCIGKEDLFSVLEKFKTLIRFFDTKNLFLQSSPNKKETVIRRKDVYVDTIDRYIHSILSKQKNLK